MSQPHPPTALAPPRSKVELLYQQILHETDALLTRVEQMADQQEQLQKGHQAFLAAIERAGVDAGIQAATHANECLMDATHSIASATSDLRGATRVASANLPAIVWRTGLMCAASALLGGVLCATTVALLI